MLNMQFTVTYVDGVQKTVTTKPKDEVSLERHFDVGVTELVDKRDGAFRMARLRMEHLYYLAWAALTREKEEVRDFDSFLDVVEEIDFLDDEDEAGEPDPTQPGALPG